MPNRRIAAPLPLPSRSTRRVLAVAATLAVGLAAAGCGSSSSSNTSTPTTAALSRSEFLTQGNAICTHGNQTLAAAEKVLGKDPSEARFKSFITSAWVPAIQDQIDGIRALAAPAADQAKVSSMLETAQTDLNRVKSNPLILNEKTFANFGNLAHPYGLTACAPNS